VLTLDKAQKAATAMQAIDQLVAANPSLNAALDASSSTTGKKPITQQAHDIDTQYQQVAAIVHQNGLATREFIVIIGALINDLGWVSMKRQGMVQSYPPGMITPENAALIEANWAAFQALGAKMTPPSTR
jgi:phenylacetate-coenzyme A ligase PaaK-like adenylate-forming protein